MIKEVSVVAVHVVRRGETLSSISLDYRRPLAEILAVNSISNPNVIYPGQQIIIPGLPDANTIPYSIEISIASRKLVLKENGIIIKTYPIAVGRMLFETPIGNYVIVNRQPNPGGPFGAMWLSLSKLSYGIHGTNDPSSIGKAVSRGCVRMYNQDVLQLASMVPNGTSVLIRPS
ncbi:L,D-transpeptidase [Sutcliffiella horikoshii]|uniref:L,D-transpeptidase n=1 Tax=Sutcliffiella horikoshii TaxID=79883 RepID=A0ABM6KI85_9BACI|nr:L,D-transpeptidase [Sutcliffiella horikoshii]